MERFSPFHQNPSSLSLCTNSEDDDEEDKGKIKGENKLPNNLSRDREVLMFSKEKQEAIKMH